jgi:YHS domain-containing protein
MVKDPVCGMMVDPETAPAQSVYKGQTYYFCAPGCRAAFEQEPGRYLNLSGGVKEPGQSGSAKDMLKPAEASGGVKKDPHASGGAKEPPTR